MRACLFSFTRNGAKCSVAVKDLLLAQGVEVALYAPKVYPEFAGEIQVYPSDLKAIVREVFASCSLLVFIGACGIAVRAIAPFVQDKQMDPAVICMDEVGAHVIPILSGHIGGANHWTHKIADAIGAQAVITTATDLNGLLAIDQWAVDHNLYIGELKVAKKISALLLEGRTVGMDSDFEVTGNIPANIRPTRESSVGFCISLDDKRMPYETTLHLVPRIVYLGIGCRRGISLEAIEKLVLDVLKKENISFQAIAGIASIDLKCKETGLVNFAAKYKLPLVFFSGQELDNIPGQFTGSDFVKQTTGVNNVCERAAVLLSDHGKIMVKKTICNGVAIALAQKAWRAHFED